MASSPLSGRMTIRQVLSLRFASNPNAQKDVAEAVEYMAANYFETLEAVAALPGETLKEVLFSPSAQMHPGIAAAIQNAVTSYRSVVAVGGGERSSSVSTSPPAAPSPPAGGVVVSVSPTAFRKSVSPPAAAGVAEGGAVEPSPSARLPSPPPSARGFYSGSRTAAPAQRPGSAFLRSSPPSVSVDRGVAVAAAAAASSPSPSAKNDGEIQFPLRFFAHQRAASQSELTRWKCPVVSYARALADDKKKLCESCRCVLPFPAYFQDPILRATLLAKQPPVPVRADLVKSFCNFCVAFIVEEPRIDACAESWANMEHAKVVCENRLRSKK